MNDKLEALLSEHIKRLEKDVAGRERNNPLDNELTKVDCKNIASLREGRIPQYSDHLDCLSGNDSIDMFEFRDLTELVRGFNPWSRDPAD